MKLRVFHVGDGDCLLLSKDDDSFNMLIDGGRSGAFAQNTRPFLAQMQEDGKELDVVYVSHIDNDHITGILRLVEDEVIWRKHEFELSLDPFAEQPDIPKPPKIGEIWHNALFEMAGEELAAPIAHTLATSASILAGSDDEGALDLASHYENLATGERAAMELSRRISATQLGISLNRPTKGAIMKRGGFRDKFQKGGMTFYTLGPSDDDLEALRRRWQRWINRNEAALIRLRNEMVADEKELGASTPLQVANPIAASLGEGLASLTEPNLASLMFLVRYKRKSILLTGDGSSAEILEGLAHHGRLKTGRRIDPENGTIHVDILKLQHHGALANITEEFRDRVTADHYIYCGNGAHHNPELEAVEELARFRFANDDKPFKVWFSSSSETPGLSDARVHHMHEVAELAKRLIHDGAGQMEAEFIAEGSFEIQL